MTTVNSEPVAAGVGHDDIGERSPDVEAEPVLVFGVACGVHASEAAGARQSPGGGVRRAEIASFRQSRRS